MWRGGVPSPEHPRKELSVPTHSSSAHVVQETPAHVHMWAGHLPNSRRLPPTHHPGRQSGQALGGEAPRQTTPEAQRAAVEGAPGAHSPALGTPTQV